jgi:hypothetical protein
VINAPPVTNVTVAPPEPTQPVSTSAPKSTTTFDAPKGESKYSAGLTAAWIRETSTEYELKREQTFTTDQTETVKGTSGNALEIGLFVKPELGNTGFMGDAEIHLAQDRYIRSLALFPGRNSIRYNTSGLVIAGGYKLWRAYGKFGLHFPIGREEWNEYTVKSQMGGRLTVGFEILKHLAVEAFYSSLPILIEQKDVNFPDEVRADADSVGFAVRLY